jgi:hypothetical protein
MYDVDDSFMNSLVQPWGSIAHVLQSAPNYRRADDPQGDRMKSMVTSIDQFVSQIATQYPAQNQSTMIFPALFAYLSALEVRHLEDPAEQSAQLKQAQAEFVSLQLQTQHQQTSLQQTSLVPMEVLQDHSLQLTLLLQDQQLFRTSHSLMQQDQRQRQHHLQSQVFHQHSLR